MASDVSPELQLAFLNSAWNNAASTANSLRDQLFSEQASSLELIKLGSIGSVGKNSTSQSYMGYGPGRITAVQITETWSRLIADYDTVKTTIQKAADAVPVSTDGWDFDQSVYDLLTKALQASGSASVLPDIRELRFPNCNRTAVCA